MTDDLDYDPALAEWLRTQLDADEQALRGSGDIGWLTFREPDGSMHHTEVAALAGGDVWIVKGEEREGYASASVVHREAEHLADIRAKRQIIDWAIQWMEGDYAPWNAELLKLLAQRYAGRPGFRAEWRYVEVTE